MKKKKSKSNRPTTKKLEEIVQKIDSIIETIDTYDIDSKSYKPIENLVLWFIAIAIGFILAIFSNISNLQINNEIPEKYFLIISLILVGFGLVTTSLFRLYLLLRDYVILTAKGIVHKVRYKIKNGSADQKDIEKFDKQYKNWLKTIDIPYVFIRFLKYGIILIISGLIVFIGYYIYFLIRYY